MDLPWWKAVALGVVQGLTEFLPVSSSGHLVLAERLLRADLPGITFEIVAHLGTLLAVLVHYRRDLADLARGALALLQGGPAALRRDLGARWTALLVLATLPAALVGLLMGEAVEAYFDHPRWLGAEFALTGTLLWLAERARRRPLPVGDEQLGARHALVMGAFQALAILPAVSRSGSTVAGGLLAGVQPETAARFTFLLFVPTALGAGLLDAAHLFREPAAAPPAPPLLLGFVAAAVSGYAAIRAFLGAVRRGRLLPFAVYTWLLGAWLLVADW